MAEKKEVKAKKAVKTKTATTSTKEAKEGKKETKIKGKYIEGIGRRKEAVARVRLYKDTPGFIINEKIIDEYFPLHKHQKKILNPLKLADLENSYLVSVQVKGGGLSGQAEAISLGISRCLVKIDEEKFKPTLRKKGLLTRDSRVVERKKFGFKKARKRAQWSKR